MGRPTGYQRVPVPEKVMAPSVVVERTNRSCATDETDAGMFSAPVARVRRAGRTTLVRTDLLRIGLVCVAAGLWRFRM
jgi:hypothetical protein